MKRPTAPGSSPLRLRRWLFPVLALTVALLLLDQPFFTQGFDPADVRANLAAGRPDAALAALAEAGDRHLLPDLEGVNWWPARSRVRRLADLRRDAERAEPVLGPRLVSPVGRHRTPPRSARLDPPAEVPTRMQLHQRQLSLQASEVPVPAGADLLPLGATLLPGSTFDVVLLDDDDGMVSLSSFELLPARMAEDCGIVLAEAHELGGAGAGGELLAAIVALHFGLTEEALGRLELVSADAGLAQVARELAAITLDRMGRPADGLARLDG